MLVSLAPTAAFLFFRLMPSLTHLDFDFLNRTAGQQQVQVTPNSPIVHSASCSEWLRKWHWRPKMPDGRWQLGPGCLDVLHFRHQVDDRNCMFDSAYTADRIEN